MSIYVGTSEIKNIYVGTTPVKEVYVGTTKVRPAGWQPGANTLAYYKFNGDLDDSSGRGNNATSLITPIYTQDGDGYCFNNTAINNYIKIPNSAKLSGNFTISMWLKVTSAPETTGNRTIIADWDSSNLNFHIYLKENSNIIKFDTGNGGSQTSLTGPNTQYNVRELITFVRNGTSVEIYMNGTLGSSGTGKIGYATSSSVPFCVCRRLPTDATKNTFGGYMDNLILENKARTATEISDYYNLTKGNYGL